MAGEAVARTEAAVADAKERVKTATGQASSLLKRHNKGGDVPTNALGTALLLTVHASLLAQNIGVAGAVVKGKRVSTALNA
jgi:hypothetical protein